MNEEIELLHRRLERQRLARKQAEEITENTCRTLFLKGEELETALERGKKARKEFEAEDKSFHVTVSIGLSECLDAKDSLDNLLIRSDQALYQAKNTGRNRVVIWDIE